MTYTVLDVGCSAGGATVGYRRAGFRVIGLDNVPQPHYPRLAPGDFIQADMLTFDLTSVGADLIHVSPPCQRWSKQLRCRPEVRELYPDLITPMRPRLEESGIPWIIENVEGAPLVCPVTLCGWQFGREMYRHRLFEYGNGLKLTAPPHRPHTVRASMAGHWEPGTFFSMAGHVSPMWKAREVMDIGWMIRDELQEAIPPYMVEYLAHQVRAQLLLAA